MKTANLGVGVMLLGMLAASACGDDASGGATPTGGTAGAGGSTGGSGGKGGTTGGTAGKSGAGGKGGSGSGGKGGSAGTGTGGSSASGGTTGDAGGNGEAGDDSGGTSGTGGASGGTGGVGGTGGTAGSGGSSAGTGGSAGSTASCEITTDLVGSCQVPATMGVGSCIEYYASAIWTPEIIETVCMGNGGPFSTGACPESSFEDLDRLGCCVTPGSSTRSCYYGEAASLDGLEAVCTGLGCALEPG